MHALQTTGGKTFGIVGGYVIGTMITRMLLGAVVPAQTQAAHPTMMWIASMSGGFGGGYAAARWLDV